MRCLGLKSSSDLIVSSCLRWCVDDGLPRRWMKLMKKGPDKRSKLPLLQSAIQSNPIYPINPINPTQSNLLFSPRSPRYALPVEECRRGRIAPTSNNWLGPDQTQLRASTGPSAGQQQESMRCNAVDAWCSVDLAVAPQRRHRPCPHLEGRPALR